MPDWPENPFSEEVLRLYIAQMKEIAELTTQRAVAYYENRYDYVKRNWEDKGQKFDMPEVPVIGLVFNDDTLQNEPVEIDGYPLPEPWTIEPEVEAPTFGVPIYGTNPVCYAVIGAGGEDGDIKQKDGRDYRLVIRGLRGRMNFVRMWKPV